MVVLLFGAPGCGKGTQSAALAERLRIPAVSTGELFRAEIKAGSRLGRIVEATLATGRLVEDELVNEMVAARTAQSDCANGFLLDGYPRTVYQAVCFSELLTRRGLPRPVVFHIDVPEAALVERLTARRQCPNCQRIYNLRTEPPTSAGICDKDGAALTERPDDCEEVIRERLGEYRHSTGRVLDWYGPTVYTVDGALPPDRVTSTIEIAIAGASRAEYASLVA